MTESEDDDDAGIGLLLVGLNIIITFTFYIVHKLSIKYQLSSESLSAKGNVSSSTGYGTGEAFTALRSPIFYNHLFSVHIITWLQTKFDLSVT